jgi:cellulose synthase/poly-beta-1,6-N-acetylglucosamine synthase-like glycosyltransferase
MQSVFFLKQVFLGIKDLFILRFKKVPPIPIPSRYDTSMVRAGVRYKKQVYITHTTLDAEQSAVVVFSREQIAWSIVVLAVLVCSFLLNPLLSFQIGIAVLSTIYLLDVVFSLYLVFKTLRTPTELTFTQKELANIDDSKLPIYTILCPMYKEVHILPQFLEGIKAVQWPKGKLDVILLIESDDQDSITAINTMHLPSFIRMVVVPHSLPKTKPKACNYGLAFARGEYTVIYDAEDIPDPLQLKKAYLGFKRSARNIVCLQAKLSYYNMNQNLLTRFFTAEYALWFDVTLTGLNSLHTTIPLGGTSNHFRTRDLKELHAWDPFNVTEDADLGMRLFKLGYQTAVIDSTTMEEGNSKVGNWLRQRSRWIKGYMQTYIVHTREAFSFTKRRFLDSLIFHLVLGGKIAFIFINPILWVVTLLYFTLYPVVGPFIDKLYPQPVLYIAMSSLIFGNYVYLFCYVMGCVKKEQWGLIKYIFLIPIYWLLISIAGMMALYQLIFKPFYWEKTVHGLHLGKREALSVKRKDGAVVFREI